MSIDPLRRRRGIGHVYVMLREDGLRKIGFTASEVEMRRVDLQAQMRMKMTTERTWALGDEAALEVEQQAIQRLAPFRTRMCMESTELVDAPLAVVVEVVRKVMLGVEFQTNSGARIMLPAVRLFGLRAYHGMSEMPNKEFEAKIELAVMSHAGWLLGGNDQEAAVFIEDRTRKHERTLRRRERQRI